MSAPDAIHNLVQRITEQRAAYHADKYNQIQRRCNFLDPFFEVLGWDNANYFGIYLCLIGFALLLTACAPPTLVDTQVPISSTTNLISSTPTRTSTVAQTPAPSGTATVSPTPPATTTPSPSNTPPPVPTAIGGGAGKLIFLNRDNSSSTNANLFTVNVDGSGFQQIPVDAEIQFFPFYISPQGRQIIFKNPSGIGTVDVDGANERMLFGGSKLYPYGWFPDGNHFLYKEHNQGLYQANIDTLDRTTINTGIGDWFTISPNGKKIVYAAQGKLFVINADGSDDHLVTTVGGHQLMWSTDSTNIIYCACSPTETKIGLVNIDGTGQRTIMKDALGAGWLNESTFLFMKQAGSVRDFSISQIDADGSNEIELVRPGKNMPWSIALSPDQKMMAFLGNCSSDYKCDIFIANVNGTDQVNITNSPGFYWYVTWQP